MKFEREVNIKLMTMSMEHLEPFKVYQLKGEAMADKIVNILRTQSTVGISRAKIAGTIGKRSSLRTSHQPDFDLVVFVNDIMPPFENVLVEFEKVLRHYFGNSNEFVFERRSSQSLQFLVKDASISSTAFISFDLLVALNLISPEQDMLSLSDADREIIQTDQTLKLILGLPNPKNDAGSFSSSFIERYVSFVNSQCEFVHDVIRLAKLWNRKVPLCQAGKVYGRSMIIELVAISAACEEMMNAKSGFRAMKIVNAFKVFLIKFVHFDRSMLVFFKFMGNSTQQLTYLQYVAQTSHVRTPMILDPINPYNNLATNLTPEMKSAFDSHAKSTLKAIRNFIQFGPGKDSDFDCCFDV